MSGSGRHGVADVRDARLRNARAPAGRSSTRGERSSRSPAHVAAGWWHARRSWIDGRVSSFNGYLYIAFFYFCTLTFVDCIFAMRFQVFSFYENLSSPRHRVVSRHTDIVLYNMHMYMYMLVSCVVWGRLGSRSERPVHGRAKVACTAHKSNPMPRHVQHTQLGRAETSS